MLEGYESVSCGHAPLLVLVVLDGIVELTLGSVEHALTPGTAVSMQLHPDYPLQAHQPEQQHLEIVALAFDPRGATLGHVSPSLHGLTTLPRVPLRKWNVPPALKELLQTYAGLTMTGVQKIWFWRASHCSLPDWGWEAKSMNLPMFRWFRSSSVSALSW